MFIHKEQYREFKKLRRVWFEHASRPTEMDASEKKDSQQAVPSKEEATIDRSATITTARKNAENRINAMLSAAPTPHKDAAKKIRDHLIAHATREFNQISQDYDAQRNSIGISFETDPQSPAKDIERKATDLLQKITERVNKGYVYYEHQTLQDSLTPEKKQAIIEKYLAEDNRMQDPKMREMLARLVVEENLIDFNYGDIDSADFKSNLDLYFERIDNYTQRIGNQLENRIKNIVDKLLADTPKAEARDEEVKVLLNLVNQENAHYGTEQKPESHQHQVALALAKQFDIQFKPGSTTEVSYATDLTSDPLMVYNAADFQNKVLLELRTNSKLRNLSSVEEYDQSVEKGTRWLSDARHTVGSGDTFLNNGKVATLNDWNGNKAASDLLRVSHYIKNKARAIEGDKKEPESANASAADEKLAAEKKRGEMVDAYYKNATEADLTGAIKEATDNGYDDVSPKDSEHPDFKETYEGYKVLRNKKGDTITVTLNSQGAISVRIDHEHPNAVGSTEAERSFSVEETMTLVKFKEKTLVERVETANQNIDKNLATVNAIAKQLEGLDNNMKIDFNVAPTFSELAADSYKTPDAPIKYDGMIVGSLSFDQSKIAVEVTVKIGSNEAKIVKVDILGKTLKDSVAAAKITAEAAKQTKGEIEAQSTSTANDIKVPEDMAYKKADLDSADFSDTSPDTSVTIGTIEHEGKTLATVSVKVGKNDGEVTRDFVLTVNDKAQTFATAEELNTYINGNELKETTADQQKAAETMEKIQEAAGPGNGEKMGIGEMISTFGEIYRMFQEAMKTGDWKSLEDALGEIQKGGNFAERIRDGMTAAKEKYETEIGNINDTGDLLSIYNDPYKSPVAIEKFDKPEKMKYRIQLKQIIEEKLEKDLSLNISEMKIKSASETVISATKGPRSLNIYVRRDGSMTYMRSEEIKNREDGTPYAENLSSETEVKNLKDGEKNFDTILTANLSAPPAAPAAPAPIAEASGEEATATAA